MTVNEYIERRDAILGLMRISTRQQIRDMKEELDDMWLKLTNEQQAQVRQINQKAKQ
jgi:hypothetical protein